MFYYLNIEIKQELPTDNNLSQCGLPNLVRYYNSMSNDYSANDKSFQFISNLDSNLEKFQFLNELNKSRQPFNLLNLANIISFNQNQQKIQNLSQIMELQVLSQHQNIQNFRFISMLHSFIQNKIPGHFPPKKFQNSQEFLPFIFKFLEENPVKFENKSNLLNLSH